MGPNLTDEIWKPVLIGGQWKIRSSQKTNIASVDKSNQDEFVAKLIATSPMMLKALQSLMELIGDDDLPDNGELSGAAICDMARSAVAMATGHENWPFSA